MNRVEGVVHVSTTEISRESSLVFDTVKKEKVVIVDYHGWPTVAMISLSHYEKLKQIVDKAESLGIV